MTTKLGIRTSQSSDLDGKPDEELVPFLDADKIMSKLGSCSFTQVFYATLVNLAWVIFAFHTLQHAFITEVPHFACVPLEYEPTGNETRDFFDKECKINQTGVNITSVICGQDNRTKFFFDPNDDFTQAVEWTMVSKCSPSGGHWLQMGSSLYMIGSLCSMVVVAQMSDTLGRKVTFITSFWLSGVVGVLCAVSPNFTSFVAFRFVLGVISVGLSNVSWVYTAELLSMKCRAIMPIYMNVIWNIGYCGVGFLAMYIPNWRVLTAVSSAPFVLTISYYWIIPESLHWLIAKKKGPETIEWVRKAERKNHMKIDLRKCLREDYGTPDFHHAQTRNLFSVLTSAALTFHIAVFSYLAIVACLVYWGLSLFSTRLSKDRFLGFFLSGLIEIPAGILGPILLLWFVGVGRRPLSIASYALSGISLFALIFVPDGDDYDWLRLTLSLSGKFGNMIVFSSAYLLMPEAIPTTLRNAGYGFISMMGKIGSVIAPYIGILGDYNANIPPLMFGGMSIVAAILCCCLPGFCNSVPNVLPTNSISGTIFDGLIGESGSEYH